MSCEIKSLSNISELKEIQEYFGISSDDNWLNDVHFSISPTCDVLSFAFGSLFIILTSRWDREKQLNTYKITFKGVMDNPNSQATAILNIPIVGQVSSHTTVDCVVICIGLGTGHVLFYSDNGNPIHSQQWHNESVTSIKAQSGKHINEEVYISYPSCVCIVQGMHLFPVLKNIKQQSSKLVFSVYKNDNPQLEQIACRKWGFGGRGQTTLDNVVAGPQKICSFDHLITACLEGGFNAKYKSSAPQNALVIGVGSKPYVGFHYAKEGLAQPVLADVARAVASKIKSALPSWFGGSSSLKQSAEQPEIQITPPELMICRFGLCDQIRNASNIWLAPGNKLAVVADSLGRIVLVDCIRGIALRLWKGYRDAQCGFIEVTEKNHKSTNSTEKRRAMFLIIYAPKRKVIEIWSLENGPKIAAFTASSNGHLIYNTHSLMGITQSSSKIKYSTAHTCIFFDPDDKNSEIKEFSIPFHCALSDSNSKTAKDLHLLKRLKIFLKSCDGDENEEQDFKEITETCQSFETREIKLQCVEMLIKNKKIRPKLLQSALKVFYEDEEEEENSTATHLQIICKNYLEITKLYIFANTINECHEKQEEEDQENMKLSENELNTIHKLLSINKKTPSSSPIVGNKVKFEENLSKANTFIDYISAFNVTNENLILMKQHDSFELYAQIGEIIFGKLIQYGNLNNFADIVQRIGLLDEDIFKMYLAYWLGQGFDYTNSEELINDMTKFNLILRKICILAGDKVKFENNTICLWWQNVREYLLESLCALRGLLAAIMCRNEALKYEETSDDEYNFEEVSQEACQWTLLIGKLEDVAVLGAILSDSMKCKDPKLPCLRRYQSPQISLKEIIKGGKGIVSELVTKWLVTSGIEPDKLILVENDDNDKNSEKKDIEKEEKSSMYTSLQEVNQLSSVFKLEPILSNLNILRQHFPFSLEAGTLICHLTWEYMCEWSKNLTHFELLQAGMTCLKAIPRLQYALKFGLCFLIWNAHLKIPLEAAKKLVNKVGRLPKEKLCLQDIGISDALVPQFLEICIEFLEHFQKSIDYDRIEQLKFEELLQEGPIPLTSLALQQNSANLTLLKLHAELSNVLLILTSFNIKYQKPIQHLFDGMSNQLFFSEINRQLTYQLPKADLILRKARLEFLCKTVSATMDLIIEDGQNIFYQEHINWMEKIEKMADVWDLDFGELRRHQVIELYAYGYDSYSEQLIQLVVDEQSLGMQLLVVAGRRLTMYTKANPSVWGQVAAVGPLLTDFLDMLISSENNQIHVNSNDISIEQLLKLTENAFKCLSGKESKSKDLRIAGLLLDACATIKETR